MPGIKARFFTTVELKKIDEDLPDAGQSQEPGFYWFEEGLLAGEIETGPCGPYKTEAEALAVGKEMWS